MVRVAGTDPGTSSLDVLILEDSTAAEQVRFSPQELQADPSLPVEWLRRRGPFDLVAGPSGYGLPLVRASDCTERDLALMSLVRRDDRARKQGVLGFSAVVRSLRESSLPVVFLPGVIHLATVPAHRKLNRIDLGTPDKLCVAALALERHLSRGGAAERCRCGVLELGSAFTACVVLDGGRVVDGLGGTSGPVGRDSGGAWDGELAYLLSPLTKQDLFGGGIRSLDPGDDGRGLFCESLRRAVAGLQAVTPFRELVLSGRLLEIDPELAQAVKADLTALGQVACLEALPGAWVKQAAQGAALLADGLAGGRHAPLIERLALRQSAGSVLDWLRHARAAEARAAF